jgi:hypothetical protein
MGSARYALETHSTKIIQCSLVDGNKLICAD